MQIIDKNDYYVSRDDLLHLFDNDEYMPLSLQLGLRDAIINDKDYIKIEEDRGLEYIYTSNIPSFDSLVKLKISDLRMRMARITMEALLEDNKGESLSLNEIIREKKNREYLIKQLKEMIAFKKRRPLYTYPDVPYPYVTGITDGELVASQSYNPDRVVIYNLDGSKLTDTDDIEFCTQSFRLFSREEELSDSLDMKYDGNYFVVKNKQRELKRRIVD